MSPSGPVSSGAELRQQQFEALVRTYSADMYRFAFWLGGDDALAQDLVQEACLRAWRAFDGLRDGAAAKAWLFTIVRREHARLYERKRLPLTDIEDHDVPDGAAWADPEQMGSDNEIRQAMLTLPPKYREPLLLQVLGGFSCAEIATALEIGAGAVMTRLFRARQQLKAMLEADDTAEDGHELR